MRFSWYMVVFDHCSAPKLTLKELEFRGSPASKLGGLARSHGANIVNFTNNPFGFHNPQVQPTMWPTSLPNWPVWSSSWASCGRRCRICYRQRRAPCVVPPDCWRNAPPKASFGTPKCRRVRPVLCNGLYPQNYCFKAIIFYYSIYK